MAGQVEAATTNTARKSRKGPPPLCSICNRTFTRREHLSRHLRSRTYPAGRAPIAHLMADHLGVDLAETPFQCPVCLKSFTRGDLLKRHQTCHEPIADGDSVRHQKRPRTSNACTQCAHSKQRCDGKRPVCERCAKKGLECHWTLPAALRHLSVDSSNFDENQQPSSPSSENDTSIPPTESMDTIQESRLGQMDAGPTFKLDTHTTFRGSSQTTSPPTALPDLSSLPGMPMDSIDQGLSALSSDFSLSTNFTPPSVDQFTSFTANFDFGFGSWESFARVEEGTPEKMLFDWDWARTEQLETFAQCETRARNTPVSPDLPPEIPPRQDEMPEFNLANERREVAQQQSESSADGDHPLREAYEESAYYWKPQAKDNVMETTTMSNLLTLVEAAKDQSALNTPSHARIPGLHTADRDRILAILYQTQSRSRGVYNEKEMTVFPSTVVFDWFIQLYFQYFHPQNPIIHLPTFDPHTTEAVLLLAIVTAGGFFAPQRAVQQFAYGLSEILRRCMASHFEADNTRTRQIGSLQAHHISLTLGCWCGNRRGMELAEAMRCTIIAMMRRGGWFSKSTYSKTRVATVEEGEEKWKEWVKEETNKRLIYFHFMLEGRTGMFFNISPCISYAELAVPLLYSEDLWGAANSFQWTRQWNDEVARGPLTVGSTIPGFAEYLRKFLTSPHMISTDRFLLSQQSLVYAFHSLVWEANQLQMVMDLEVDEQPDGFSNTSITSRRQDLERLLKIWEKTHTHTALDDEMGIFFFYHLVSLNLFANLDNMRLFTGREDHLGGRRVYPQLQRWRMTNSSRKALWHAGQIVRLCRDEILPAGAGRRLMWAPAAVHQACLVLWSYGILIAIRREARPHHPPPNAPAVHLDMPQRDADITAFVDFGEGDPCITRPDGVLISLDRPDLVAFECARLLSGVLTPYDAGLLSENIANVLQALGSRTEVFKKWLKIGTEKSLTPQS